MAEFSNINVSISEQAIQIQVTGGDWTIPDFQNWIQLQPFAEPISSPVFQVKSVLPFPDAKFELVLTRLSDLTIIGFHLKNVRTHPIRVLVCTVTNRSSLFEISNLSLDPNTISKKSCLKASDCFKEKDFKMLISGRFEHTVHGKNPVEPEVGSLAHDLKAEREHSEMADVILVCQEKEFPCLKALLALR